MIMIVAFVPNVAFRDRSELRLNVREKRVAAQYINELLVGR